MAIYRLSLLVIFICVNGKDIGKKEVVFRHRRSWSSPHQSSCSADIKKPAGFLGYFSLSKENVEVKFIKLNESYHIARVKWTIPKEKNAPSLTATTIYVGRKGLTAHSCITLIRNKTSIDIQPFAGWSFGDVLMIVIIPQPPREQFNPSVLEFIPEYEEPMRLEEPNINKPKRDNTKIIIGSVTGVAMGIILIVIVVLCHPRKPPPPTHSNDLVYHVSYFPESKTFIKKVEDFVCWSRENGFNVQMDTMLSEENGTLLKEIGPVRFAEVVVRQARNVFMIVSPSYLQLCRMDERETRQANVEKLSQDKKTLYYEIINIRNDLCLTMFRGDRFIPILFNVKEQELPFWMKELVLYSWPEDGDKLLFRLSNLPEFAAPEENGENIQQQSV